MRQLLAMLVLASLFAAASAGAAQTVNARDAWAGHWARAADAQLAAKATSAAACALGDVDGDNVSDILLRTKGSAGAKLAALSGADPTRVVWETEMDASSRLTCAADIGGDGALDPLVETVRYAQGNVPDVNGVSATEGTTTLAALDGLTGKPLLSRDAAESARGGEAASAAGSASTDAALEVGAQGVYLLVTSERTTATAELLEGLMLSTDEADVVLEILDSAGERLGTIEAPDPGTTILSHAVVSDALDEARILVLSAREASPIDQAPAQLPVIASHATDGSVAWSVELSPTTGDLLLIPQAGDLDADGIQDLIVETLPTGVPVEGGSALAVLSGADGSVLLERASETGLLAALPLGDITPAAPADAQALLVMAQETAGAPLNLECLQEGVTCWTAELPAGAEPVNGALDPFTGDLQGFSDLTGDGVPDIATLAPTDGGTLSVVSGVDGSASWSIAIEQGSRVVPLPGPRSADLLTMSPLEGASEIVLKRIRGVDGSTVWSIAAPIAGSFETPAADIEVSKDTRAGADAPTTPVADAILLTIRDEAAEPGEAEQVYQIDPADGDQRWAGTTTTEESAAPPPEFEARSIEEESRDLSPVPAPGALLGIGILGAVALLAGRRRSR